SPPTSKRTRRPSATLVSALGVKPLVVDTWTSDVDHRMLGALVSITRIPPGIGLTLMTGLSGGWTGRGGGVGRTWRARFGAGRPKYSVVLSPLVEYDRTSSAIRLRVMMPFRGSATRT